jgi:aldehyde:ferredoxin oxidoreductase
MALGGVHRQILQVDLSRHHVSIEQPDDEFYRQHVGGRALVAYYLLRETSPETDPLGPDNLLIFAPGILTGTGLPGSGRHGVGALSPLTGFIASSEVGGWWGAEFKRAGFDALVVRGTSPNPVYLWIDDGDVEIRPATHLTGQMTADCQTMIRKELGDPRVRVAQIGPAGERLVPYATLMHDVNRAAGRGGLGAVMASKRLRAVAVRGTGQVPVVNRAPLDALRRWLNTIYREQLAWLVDIGTPASVDSLHAVGGLPTRNFRDPLFEHATAINGAALANTILTGRDTCHACPIRCKQIVEHHGAPDIDPAYGGPEYETLAALGSNCGIDDLVAIAKANELCAAHGLDTISTGATIAFAMECVERGILPLGQLDGLDLRFGNAAAMVEAVRLIALGQDFGVHLALGTRRLATELGPEAESFALHVKGLEPGMHEPRLKPGMGVSFAVCPVGADHMQSMHDTSYVRAGPALERLAAVEDLEPVTLDEMDKQKVRILVHDTNWRHFQDSALLCMFYPYSLVQIADVMTAITGTPFESRDLLLVGQRAATLCRLVNLRRGLLPKDDDLPARFLAPFDEGPLAGRALDRDTLAAARSGYYELMGWSRDGGIPNRGCLERLEIEGAFWPG